MFVSTFHRGGEPVLLACGVSVKPDALHADLLMANPPLPEVLTMRCATSGKQFKIQAPVVEKTSPHWFTKTNLTYSEATP